jgi:hypothetical protein
MMMNHIPVGRYYGGTRTAHGGWVHPEDPDGVPLRGEHLLIGHAGYEKKIFWSLHSVWKNGHYSINGDARIVKGILVLKKGYVRYDVSHLVPQDMADPDLARAYLAEFMTGLPSWPLEVKLPECLQREEPLATQEEERLAPSRSAVTAAAVSSC